MDRRKFIEMGGLASIAMGMPRFPQPYDDLPGVNGVPFTVTMDQRWQLIDPLPDPPRGKLIKKIPMQMKFIDENHRIWVYHNSWSKGYVWTLIGAVYFKDSMCY